MNNSILRIRRMFLVPLAVLVLFDLVLIVVLATKLTATTNERQHRRDSLQQEKVQLDQELKPFQDIDKKLPVANTGVQDFYNNRFPAYYSSLSEELNKLSQQEGIQLSNITYAGSDLSDSATLRGGHGTPGAQPLRITTSISGDYPKIVKFINALERDQTVFFIVEKLGLSSAGQGQPGQGPGAVSLQLSLLTFMRKV